MIFWTLILLSNEANKWVRFFILNEGLIRPDQGEIVSRPMENYQAADFGEEYYDKWSGNYSKYNLGNVSNPVTTNNISVIISKIIRPDPTMLDTEIHFVEWYVLKNESDGWHIDGQWIPREFVTVKFYKDRGGKDFYASARIQKGSNYSFDDDSEIWNIGEIVTINGKNRTFDHWEYRGNYTALDDSGRRFLADRNMTFYAVWKPEIKPTANPTDTFTDYSEMELISEVIPIPGPDNPDNPDDPDDQDDSDSEPKPTPSTVIIVASVLSAVAFVAGISIAAYFIHKCRAPAFSHHHVDIHKMDGMISI